MQRHAITPMSRRCAPACSSYRDFRRPWSSLRRTIRCATKARPTPASSRRPGFPMLAVKLLDERDHFTAVASDGFLFFQLLSLFDRSRPIVSQALQDLPLPAVRVEGVIFEEAPHLLLKCQTVDSNGAVRPSAVSAEVPLRGLDDRKPPRIGIRMLILKLRDQPDGFTTVVIGCLRAALDDRKHAWLSTGYPGVSRYVH